MKITWIMSCAGSVLGLSLLLYICVIIRRRKKTPPISPKQQLLQELAEQREAIAGLQYRKNCAVLFDSLSRGVQDFLAQETRPCPSDKAFCGRLRAIANNESMLYKMENQKPRPIPEPISQEIRQAEADVLRERIRLENAKNPPLALDLPWDSLTEDMIPVLKALISEAQEGNAEACRRNLAELKDVLSKHNISAVFCSEELENTDPQRTLDYVFDSDYPIPALYYSNGESTTHVGAPGRGEAK